MTRFYKTNPNRTSDKIKPTSPVDSYTIVLVVLAPLKLLEAGFNRRLFWGERRAQMAVLGLVKDLAWQDTVVYWWTA